MKNLQIQKAIEEFKDRRLKVYKADRDQIVRDTRVAERATKDHVGRWLFELLQNSDDAGASEVLILINENILYVADNGHGLKYEAVSSICGTDFSDKKTGTIGRKGVGFKSVYEVSQNPQLLTVDGEGIEFSPNKAKEWLSQNKLDSEYVPYQWIPFYVSWDEAQKQDSYLKDSKFKEFRTIVRLPDLSPENKQKVKELLFEWSPHALFAFRHIRKFTAPEVEITVKTNDGVWLMLDSRGKTPREWRVAKHHIKSPPNEFLKMLGEDERKAVSSDGVSFLIATPFDNKCTVPTEEYLPVHVFYPTEQISPVRLLLHAEFLVKGDRTALIPIESNTFNDWVADQLSKYVCKFVNESFCQEFPSSHLALLVPFSERKSHPVAETIWHRIFNNSKEFLRLADIECKQRLNIEDARLISVSIHSDLARILLESTGFRQQLLHHSFDKDKEANTALRELGVKEFTDQDLIETIMNNARLLVTNEEWIWTCWEWLAAWVADKPYGEEHKSRIEQIKTLPIIPVDSELFKISDLANQIVTWRPDENVGDLPEWLPITFVDDWFRNRLESEPEKHPQIHKLISELDIKKPDEDVILQAVGKAIDQYWKKNEGEPGRFLDFIFKQDWHVTFESPNYLKRCPVPISQSFHSKQWVKADSAYFGREWGNNLLAELFTSVSEVAWVTKDFNTDNNNTQSSVLKWLGVVDYPRVITKEKEISLWSLPNDGWRKYLLEAKDDFGRIVKKIKSVSELEHLDIENLDPQQGVILIRLLVHHWKEYYVENMEVTVEGSLGSERYNRSWKVKAKWWWELCEKLRVPLKCRNEKFIPLKDLWLPDKQTERALGELLPTVELNKFENDKNAVHDWLIKNIGLRTKIEQVTIEEWKDILYNQIPNKYSAYDEKYRDKITNWYIAFLETAADSGNFSEGIFKSCPLLCRKGDNWEYVASDKHRYLNDDDELANLFRVDVWIFNIFTKHIQAAEKYFGVLPLSKKVNINYIPEEQQSNLSGELNERLINSIPYVWVWRSSQSKQNDKNSLAHLLKSLKVLVVPSLKVSVDLEGFHHEGERPWYVKDTTIYLKKDHLNEVNLAQALAKLLNKKSEADFYENLFRCSEDSQRKEKLLSKGLLVYEIDKSLGEYNGLSDEVEPSTGKGESTGGEDNGGTQVNLGGVGGKLPRSNPLKSESGKDNGGKIPAGYLEPKVELKDPTKAKYIIGEPVIVGGGGSEGASDYGGKGYSEDLTEEQKADLEKAGRSIARRELEKLGFSVEEMPTNNPGFDLRANKNKEELRIEVKAHLGRALKVELTQREYKEYLGQKGYRWELWNIEHLKKDDGEPVVITRYDEIPEDALDTKIFRVDLKKCKKIKEE